MQFLTAFKIQDSHLCGIGGPLMSLCRRSLPTDDPEWEEMKKQKEREERRKEDLEMLHNSMFG